MGGIGERQSFKSAILIALVLVVVPCSALNIGVQSANSSIYASKQQCSRKCESEHCTVPPFLRYGKYCGILYTGCPGERPCDGLDACCQVHDNCVQTHNNDYLSLECNGNFLNCIAGVKESQGSTFRGNTCIVDEVVDVLSLVMEAALLAGRVLHKP